MNKQIRFCVNKASALEIAILLNKCDLDFVPPLSKRLEINKYVDKIVNNAERFEAYSENTLIGLVAAYSNDLEHRVAYITNASVLPAWRKKGIASELIKVCIKHLTEFDFKRIELKVNRENLIAADLYMRNGFQFMEAEGQDQIMFLDMLHKVGMSPSPVGVQRVVTLMDKGR